MAVVEFDHQGQTYRVDLPGYKSDNIHSLNLIRDKITISTDLLSNQEILVSWGDVAVLRIVS
jgi:hypothetical protein